MKLVLVGLNHRSAPLEVRERLYVPRTALPAVLDDLKRVEGVDESLVLSTCNRTELITRLSDPVSGAGRLVEFLCARHALPAPDLERHLYRLHDLDAVRHTFRVTSSLDSMVLGEPQILGQVKEAYLASLECRALGKVLDGLMRHSFEVAKKVRTRTGIARHPVSVSQAAVSLARQIFGSLSGKNVMLLGAGKMSELAARHLVQDGVRSVLVSNRTYERAVEIARRFHGVAVTFERMAEHFDEVDIVISSTGAPHFVLRLEDVAAMMRRRRGRPVFLIDIAVPRDIDPRVNTLENVYLYDIDDLEQVVNANRQERQNEALLAESLVEEEVAAFRAWLGGLEAGPAIAALRDRCHRLKDEELRRFLEKHRDLSEPQRRELEALLHTVINKILHEPSVRLRRTLGGLDGALKVEAIRDLFGLDETDSQPSSRRGDGAGKPEPL